MGGDIFYSGRWGTVYDDNWDITDTNVIRRDLGFSRATASAHPRAKCVPSRVWWYLDG